MEFVVLVSFMLLIFFSFFLSFQNKIVEVTKLQDIQYLKEANDVVISELDLASRMYSDYEREFTIPALADKPFEMNLTVNELTSRYNGIEYVNFLSMNVTGELLSDTFGGVNTIYRTDGVIYLPDGSIYVNDTYSGFFANVNPEVCYYYNLTNRCFELDDFNPVFRKYCDTYFNIECPACGDGFVGTGEQCDNGNVGETANGNICVPNSFPGSCVYCNSTCQNETFSWNCGDGVCQFGDMTSACTQDSSNDCAGDFFMTSTTNGDFVVYNNFSTLISANACPNKGSCDWDFSNLNYLNNTGGLVLGPINYGVLYSVNETSTGDFQVNLSNLTVGACFEYTNITFTINVSNSTNYWVQTFSYPIINCPYCDDGNKDDLTTDSPPFNYVEECDNGTENGNACIPEVDSSCTYCDGNCDIKTIFNDIFCGDNDLDIGEECDNGTLENGIICQYPYNHDQQFCPSCSTDCKNVSTSNSYCGDGVVNVSYGEICDNGTGVNTDTPTLPGYGESPLTYCDLTCQTQIYTPPYCGDNNPDYSHGEDCDPPSTCHPSYGSFCHYCNSTCQDVVNYSIEECGDNIIQNPPEICDNGTGVNTDTPTDPGYGSPAFTYCDLTCQTQTFTSAYCGDNNPDYADGEECDNGTLENGMICQYPYNYDQQFCSSCSNICKNVFTSNSFCGDGTCDAGDENAYICPADCPAVCGDGYITHTEECDPDEPPCNPSYGNTCIYCDSCSNVTIGPNEYCGDNINQTWEGEVCDLGTNNDQCSAPRYNSNCSNKDITECCSSSCTSYEISYGGCCGDGNIDSTDGEACDAGHLNGFCHPPSYKSSCPNENTCCTSSCQTDTLVGGCCGDGLCDTSDEDSSTCPADCPIIIHQICGDGKCLPPETSFSCPDDCGGIH